MARMLVITLMLTRILAAPAQGGMFGDPSESRRRHSVGPEASARSPPATEAEPHLVSYRLLEGVVEPFHDPSRGPPGDAPPAWKVMKRAADLKAANHLLRQALAEYGQLLRHPYMFAEMPVSERYDVFISMSKLLKTMGFYQKAELLLYESLSYAQDPSEAHLQLALMFLDKEDLARAKTHIKNCLFYKENDVLLLVHLTVVLICEGKIQEAKFYASRVLGLLESRVQRLSFLLDNPDNIEGSINSLTPELVQHQRFLQGIEDLLGKVFHCEYRFVPSASVDVYRLFSSLHGWMARGEMEGRFVFDLGQALYESGRPDIGLGMMLRGQPDQGAGRTSVSDEVVLLRMGLEFPMVPSSLLALVEAYLNVTAFLSRTENHYTPLPIENLQDVYWPLPLIQGSALPVAAVFRSLLHRFEPPATSAIGTFVSYSGTLPQPPPVHKLAPSLESTKQQARPIGSTIWQSPDSKAVANSGVNYLSWAYNLLSLQPSESTESDKTSSSHHPPRRTDDGDAPEQEQADSSEGYAERLMEATKGKVEKQAVPATDTRPVIEVGILGGHMNNHPVGHMALQRLVGLTRARFKVTLLALPLVNSDLTRRIVGKVTRVVNVPSSDVNAAFSFLANLHFDMILFPDWQPFPDQSSLVFQSLRIAPVQICFYVRGGSCGTMAMDYYIIPEETLGPREGRAHAALGGHRESGGSAEGENEGAFGSWSEQVVRLDWPVFTVHSVRETALKAEGPQDHSSGGGTAGDADAADDQQVWEAGVKAESSSSAGLHTGFTPTELEGAVFFEDQPVMLLAAHPMMVHPLMDDAILEILRSVPTLQLLVVVSESFFSHAKSLDSSDESVASANPLSRRRMSWAGKLVRRLWEAAGSPLSHRIRLLPEAFSSVRLNQIIKNVDLVLDTFPYGQSLDVLSAALFYGTPIVTMRSGTKLATSSERLKELKKYFLARQARYRGSELLPRVLTGDLPWADCISSVAPALEALGLDPHLVANSTWEYVRIATTLLKESGREDAYEIRVKLFDALDRLPVSSPCFSTSSFIPPDVNVTNAAGEIVTIPCPCAAPQSGIGRRDQPHNDRFVRNLDNRMGADTKQGMFLSDLERFLWTVGRPWATGRVLKQRYSNKPKSVPRQDRESQVKRKYKKESK